ncbi:peptide/nickel transport system ATP-binding protein [Knoellia remsis]|uniref:Peptide/nickel transport system ATP-binding protein n=1 Tax=Knoellia remsis TaxID=407159 RepID=A0A2T0UQT7_9MICO|nr:ABC transporter ATP-binding protein [Knoellia remsis]PRY60273.1 peptide/nickel transport system ATP-binding protein [Knoellia remsis]
MTDTLSTSQQHRNDDTPLLSVRDLRVTFHRSGEEPFVAVDGVSFDLRPGDTLGIVGESGSGKSVTSLAIMGLLPKRGVRVEGEVLYNGTNLLTLSPDQMRDRRGAELGMIFQDPLSSLNPVVPIGVQVTEVLERHRGMSRKAATPLAREMLDRVGIPDPDRRLKDYPHQLSGGMRQRALIAMALAAAPRVLIADEPTTALDVTIQAQILAVLKDLVEDTGTAMIMITHDLGVVAGLVDRVNVMYAGRVVEAAERHPLFADPRHPYTWGLLQSIPRLDGARGERLNPIPGSVSDNLPWTSACAFAPRCSQPIEVCTQRTPELVEDHGRSLRCFNPIQHGRPSPDADTTRGTSEVTR